MHPVSQARLVVQHVSDLHLAELELGAPEQRIEGANVDADPAVHAQREVDIKAVELVLLAGLAASATGRGQLFVAFDVDAPVWALTGTQHAGSAVVMVQRNNATGAIRWRFLDVGVLHGVRTL